MTRGHDRVRASFALVLGGLSVLAGALGRFVSPTRWPIELVITAVALMVVGLLAWVVVRPLRGQALTLGATPLAALLAVGMAVWALIDPAQGGALWPSAVAAVGGVTTLAALARWSLAGRAHLGPRPAPDPAHRYGATRPPDVRLKMTPARALAAGDRIEVPAGQLIPTDGTLVDGDGFADERALTGAELAVSKAPGDPVLAGTHFDADLTYTATAAQADSLAPRLHAQQAALLAAIAGPGAGSGGRAVAWIVIAAAILASCAVGLLAAGPRAISTALGILLALNAGVPLIASRRALARALSGAVDRGVIPARPEHITALARAVRWQVDVSVLAPTSTIEVLGDADELLPVARALLADTPGPEARAVASAMRRKKLSVPQAAALRRGNGAWHGTVAGERWCLGPVSVVVEDARVTVPNDLTSGLAFFADRAAVVWLLARTGDAVAGALGVMLSVEAELAAVARTLGATVMPGPPDGVRTAMAEAAGLVRDGPPLRSRDASLLAPGSPGPSTGLVVELREPHPDVAWAAPITCFTPSATALPEVVRETRALRRRAWVATALGTLLPAALVAPLLAIGGLDPVLGTLAGALGVVLAARAGRPLTAARAPSTGDAVTAAPA